MKYRNPWIELSRFIGSIIILCHHSYILKGRTHFVGGWVFVEFFFILTGFFTIAHFNKVNDNIENIDIAKISVFYVKDKILKLIPYAWCGIFLGFIYENIRNLTYNNIIKNIISLPYNLLLLQGLKISNRSINFDAALWYITHIMVFLPLIVFFILKFKYTYKYLICWFVPLIFLSLLMEIKGKIAIWEGGYLQYFRSVSWIMIGTLLFFLLNMLDLDCLQSNL